MKFDTVEELVSFAIKARLPEWQRKLFSKYSSELTVHSKGELFYKIDRLFPNEHPDSKVHRLLAFEPITRASFWKGINNIIEIFQNSSYTAEASENTINYITQQNWDKKNLFSYFLDEWTRVAIAEDANALCVVYPPEYLKDYPNTQQLTFIQSRDIRYHSEDLVIFVSEAESDISITLEDVQAYSEFYSDPKLGGNINFSLGATRGSFEQVQKVKIIKEVLHVFTKDKFYRLEQNDKDHTKYDWVEWKINKNFIPVSKLGGVATDSQDIQESFFQSGIPMANLALLQHSQHTAVNFMYSFPRMSELQSTCDYPKCQNGLVMCDIDEFHPDGTCDCPRCHGSGYTSNQTPYKLYIKKYDSTGLQGDQQHLNVDDVKYYTPPVDILNYSKEEWKDYLAEFERSLFIQQVIPTGNVQSAKSKELDLKDKYSFLKRIAKVFYEKVGFVLQCYENYLNASPNQVSISAPFSFAIVTEGEAFDALNNILISNAPVLVKANQIDMFINKFISESSPIRKAFNVLKLVDKLLYYPILDVNTLKSNGVITADQWSIHTFSYPVLMEMYNSDPKLFLQDTGKIAAKLLTELDKYKPAPQQSLAQKIQNNLQQQIKNGNAQPIINNPSLVA